MSLEDLLIDSVRRAVRDLLQEELPKALADRGASDSWCSTETVAAYLDTTPEAVRDLVRRGLLVGRKLPGSSRWLFRRSEIDALVVEGREH